MIKCHKNVFLFAWTVDWWYAAGGWIGVERSPDFKALFLDSQSSFLILNCKQEAYGEMESFAWKGNFLIRKSIKNNQEIGLKK